MFILISSTFRILDKLQYVTDIFQCIKLCPLMTVYYSYNLLTLSNIDGGLTMYNSEFSKIISIIFGDRHFHSLFISYQLFISQSLSIFRKVHIYEQVLCLISAAALLWRYVPEENNSIYSWSYEKNENEFLLQVQ